MRISFDFDGTLDDNFDGTLNKQKEEIQKLAMKYVSEGHDVYIITKRYEGDETIKVRQLANSLGITKIYSTNREMKYSYILGLGIERHFDDESYEIDLIKQFCRDRNHSCQVIPVEDPYWRDLVY